MNFFDKATAPEQRLEGQQTIQDKHNLPRNSSSTNNQFTKINDTPSGVNQEQPEWREELGKLKEELEIERRQRDKLESELRNQNNQTSQTQEKRLQEDTEEINALYQKIFMTRELKARENEKNKYESQNSNNQNSSNNYQSYERHDEEEGLQNEYDDRGFAPKFQHKEMKENSHGRSVQFEETGRRNSIFKNESISTTIPKSYSSNLNLKKNEAMNGQGESDYNSSRAIYSNLNGNQQRSSSQTQRELKKIVNQEGLQKKPPKTGGLASTPQSKKQIKDQGSRDNSQKRYSTVSTAQLGHSTSQENYNTANYSSSNAEYMPSKISEEHVTDKKVVKQFIKEIDRLKKVIEQKKRKGSNQTGNQTPTIATHSASTNNQQIQDKKSNKNTSNSVEQHSSNTKKSTKTPITSSKKVVVSNSDGNKKNLIRSNSANKPKI